MSRLRLLTLFALAAAALGAAVPTPSLAQNAVQTQPIDPFGQQVTLTAKTIVYASGTGSWDTALETLTEAFKTVQAFFDKQGLKASGPKMTIYTAIDDMGFNFQAAIPVETAPKTPDDPNIAVGASPEGKALKFVHRGTFEAMTATYDDISHFVEEKQVDTQEILVEEYVADLLTAPADKLVVNIFVPLK
jgi:effector-binding domain-containing protein